MSTRNVKAKQAADAARAQNEMSGSQKSYDQNEEYVTTRPRKTQLSLAGELSTKESNIGSYFAVKEKDKSKRPAHNTEKNAPRSIYTNKKDKIIKTFKPKLKQLIKEQILEIDVYKYKQVVTMIEEISMHCIKVYSREYSMKRQSYILNALEYLDQKNPEPKYLGAFSFCVESSLLMYGREAESTHFVFRNPGYAEVFSSFGGDMSAPIEVSREDGPKIYDKFPLSTTDIRPSHFSEEIFQTFGEYAPLYNIVLPLSKVEFVVEDEDIDFQEEDFLKDAKVLGLGPPELQQAIDEESSSDTSSSHHLFLIVVSDFAIVKRAGMLSYYIKAGVGPRMLFDPIAPIDDKIFNEVVETALSHPLLSKYIHLFSQVMKTCVDGDIDLKILREIAIEVENKHVLNAIKKHDNLFRIALINSHKRNQIIGAPFDNNFTSDVDLLKDIVFSTEIHEEVEMKGFSKPIKRGRTELNLDPDVLSARTIRFNEAQIAYQTELIKASQGECKVHMPHFAPVDNPLEYSPIDLFLFSQGKHLYVRTSGDLDHFMKGIDPESSKEVGEYVVEAAKERHRYIQENDLVYPSASVVDIAMEVLHPEQSIVDILNKLVHDMNHNSFVLE